MPSTNPLAYSSLESREPAAEATEFIRVQFGNRFGDFFDFHVTNYTLLSPD
jgi:hypothetical protein